MTYMYMQITDNQGSLAMELTFIVPYIMYIKFYYTLRKYLKYGIVAALAAV